MFEQVMVAPMGKGSRACATVLGMAGEALLVATAIVVPLVSPQSLPRPHLFFVQLLPHTPPPPPPPAETASPRTAQAVPRNFQMRDGVLTAPVRIPAKPAVIDEPPVTGSSSSAGAEGGVPGGIAGGIGGGILDAVLRAVAPARPAAAPAPPPPVPAQPTIVRLRVGGQVQHGKLVHQVIPVYPALARQTRISGAVELVGIIGTDGRIRELQLVKGHPLLVRAALEAVRQWVYRPTYLNGDPVEVVSPITVNFTLN